MQSVLSVDCLLSITSISSSNFLIVRQNSAGRRLTVTTSAPKTLERKVRIFKFKTVDKYPKHYTTSFIHKPVESTEVQYSICHREEQAVIRHINVFVGGWKTEQWRSSVNRRPNNTHCHIWAKSTELEQSAKAMHGAVHNKELATANVTFSSNSRQYQLDFNWNSMSCSFFPTKNNRWIHSPFQILTLKKTVVGFGEMLQKVKMWPQNSIKINKENPWHSTAASLGMPIYE